jgi:Putative auto-transporter adhesin, head GIN domain
MKSAIFYRMSTLVLASVFFLVACSFSSENGESQDDDRTTRTFSLTGFDRLSLGSAFEITVTKGNHAVKVEGRKEDLNDLEADVSGGKLRIRYKDSFT